jgi:hypothetical protein
MPNLPQLDPRAQAAVVAALLLAPLLVAVVGVEALGLQDLPQHLLVAQLAATAPGELPPGVTLRSVPLYAPYRTLYAALGVLGPGAVAGVGRALVALYLLGGAGGVLWVATRLRGGEPRLAVAGVAALSSAFFWSGFLAYLLAVPFLLALVGCLLELLARRNEGALGPPLSGACLALVGLYLLHPLVLALGAVACLLAVGPALGVLWRPESRRRGVALVAPFLLGAPLAVVALGWVMGASGQGEGLWSAVLAGSDGVSHRLGVLARTASIHFGPVHRGWADLGAALLGVGLGLPLVQALRRRWQEGAGQAGGVEGGVWVVGGLAGVACAATLAFPWVLGGLAYAGPRFALPLWALLAALAAGVAPTGRARRLAVGLTWSGTALLVAVTVHALVAVSAEQRALVELGRRWGQEPARPRVLVLSAVEHSPTVSQVWMLESAAPGQALVQGRGVPQTLFGNPFLPVAVEPLAAPPAERPWDYDPAVGHGVGATHVLLRSPPRRAEIFASTRARLARDFELAATAGAWEVWRRRAP